MRTAYEKGYHVITLTDCCAATRCATTTMMMTMRGEADKAGRRQAEAAGRVRAWGAGAASPHAQPTLPYRLTPNPHLLRSLSLSRARVRTSPAARRHIHTHTQKKTAGRSQEAHDAAVAHTFPMFSVPATRTEFLARL